MGSLTADQLSSQLKQIKKGINEAQLIADDKVVRNFNDLHLPVNSEVNKNQYDDIQMGLYTLVCRTQHLLNYLDPGTML